MARKSTKTAAHLVMNVRNPVRPDLQEVILSALRKFGSLTVADLTEGLGYRAPTTVNSQITNLYEEGLVKRERRGPGLPYHYSLMETP